MENKITKNIIDDEIELQQKKKILASKSRLFKYKISDTKVLELISRLKNDQKEVRKLLNDELKRRNEERDTASRRFTSIKSLRNLSNIFGYDDKYGKLFYFIYKKNRYKAFTIPKKTGGERYIQSPNNTIKYLQTLLNYYLQNSYNHSRCSYGFIPGKSIVDNAKKHKGKKYVLNIDIKDFFPTINFGRIRGMFISLYKFPDSIATHLTNLCCHENSLPQGAPTSPVISNIICYGLDKKLSKLAKTNSMTFTRYADDLTFSSNKNVYSEDLIISIKEIIQSEGFEVNEKKLRLQNQMRRQEVTGLVVNERVNVKRARLTEIRNILYRWEKYGLENAAKAYKEVNNLKMGGEFVNSIHGQIEFVGMVRGKEDGYYLKFLEKFERLKNSKFSPPFKEGKEIETDKKRIAHNKELKHDPINFINSLSAFTSSGSNLKWLVHMPNNGRFDFEKVLEDSEKEYNNIKNFLPYQFHSMIWKKIIKPYKNEGKKFWDNNRSHPLNNNEFEKKIKSAKKLYRFCKGDPEEATNFYTMLNEIINELSSKFNRCEIEIVNKNNIELLSFYNDVTQIRHGIKDLLYDILKRCENKIKIELRCRDNINELCFINMNTKSSKTLDETKLRLENFDGSLGELRNKLSPQGHFFTRCDWHIEGYFDEEKKYFRIKALDKGNPNLGPIKIKEIKNPEYLNSFTHKLIFYG